VPETEIDQLVYSLYGLMREEIAIIEESLQEKNGGVADNAAYEEHHQKPIGLAGIERFSIWLNHLKNG
jgi:hypothetical protein